ncbi:hypothetical protein B296_00023927 [Ensete ventricosum]|uniref:Uncharacterized protein n=1 Tax=Ensete ventricosum TaxID=4639 RepID=A0A426YLQ5_ENSVE|nr:hypothetical protein B296_00023927 [Ensete ventricosum]
MLRRPLPTLAVVNIAEPDDSVVQEEHEEERKPRAPKRAAHQFRWRGSFPVRNQKGAVEPDSHSDVAEVSRETWVGRQRSTASGCSNRLKTTFFKSACSASLVASVALLDDCCLCTHGLLCTLRLSLRFQSHELVGPSKGLELTTAASIEIPKSSSPLLAGVHYYLCYDDNLKLSDTVLKLPVLIPLAKSVSIVRCVEPSPSVSESLDLILDGAQKFVALIGSISRKMLTIVDFYWPA